MPVEMKAAPALIPYGDQNFMMADGLALRELLAKTAQRRARRNLMKEYGEMLCERRKERGITMIELSGKTGVSRDDIELAERGLLRLTSEEKQRIAKFLKRQRII